MSSARIITTTDEVIVDIYGELGAALAQTIPSDDRIIMGHILEAHAKLRAILDASSARAVIPIATKDETAELILALARGLVLSHLPASTGDALTERARRWLEANAPGLLMRADRNIGGR